MLQPSLKLAGLNGKNIMKHGHGARAKSLVVGLDSSTTSTKAIAFDNKGDIAAVTHVPIRLYSSRPGYYEQNAWDWDNYRKYHKLFPIYSRLYPYLDSVMGCANSGR